jgi:hypothetical protein
MQYDTDPETDTWERLLFDFVGVLPIETSCRRRGKSNDTKVSSVGFQVRKNSFQVSVFRFQVQRFFLKPDT